ncbi:oligopeptide ABC transporter substrate-binding protein [Abiotrophia defectiva]|uniref:oligopeptide ABC transporter substrate-binding protein n=1 Tax=Abiotrophia defectiva TaxID=46125 RepID=UPI0028D0666F|nr:oligopeptide ABC transporter substrate-binding protein [Abiotrophia defectiva]
MNKTFRKNLALMATALSVSAIMWPSAIAVAEGANLPLSVTNEGTAIDGGVFKYALVGDPFSGALSSLYAEKSNDMTITGFINPGLYGSDGDYKIDDSGLAKLTFDQANKKVTIKIPEGVTWTDGQPLTIEDVIYPYYVVGHKDYTGIRYGSDFKNVVGMEEYHDGKSDTISGLKKVDYYTLEISYKEFSASMLQAGGGVSSYVEPKHILEKTPIKDLEDSEQVRTNPVGFGPFKVKSITPGESVVFERNDNYYKGKPKLAGLQVDVVNASTAVSEMKAGNYDYASLPEDAYNTYKDASNFKTLGRLTNVYSYIGFHVGTWNKEKEQVQPDDSKPVSNKALRQAMGYAIDNDAIGKRFYEGLRVRANSPIPSMFASYNDGSIEGYTYQPEKAKQILADAGFVDKDGDGFVEDPKGNSFKLTFASMSGSDVAEPIAQYYVDAWKQIGVNVELYEGRLLEFNTFYDLLDKDADIDVFQAAMGVGGDPNPSTQFGRDNQFNTMRWATDENDKLLAAINSDSAFEDATRKKAYDDWQKYVIDEAPVIPTLYRHTIVSINNRVKHYDITLGSGTEWEEVELTADQPVKE